MEDDGVRRIKIHCGTGKYPLLRTVESPRGLGRVPTVSTMVADHVMVPLPSKEIGRLQQFINRWPGLSIRKVLADGNLALLRFPKPESPLAMEHWLGRLHDAGFTNAGPDYVQKNSATPNDPDYHKLWNLHNTGQIYNGSTGTTDADIDAPEAWDITTGSAEVLVAVIDSGVDYTHPDLAANMWTDTDGTHGYDFFANDSDPQDENGHGTHVAGTIAAVGNNGIGVTGVAWNAKIMACRFTGPDGKGFTSDAISAIRYAVDKGAKILNNSWGSTAGTAGDALNQEITRARNLGVLFVAAAGNLQGGADETRNNDVYPTFPANYPDDNIISVAATDRTDALASFSHYGATTVDIAAPGKDIYSTTRNNTYQYMSGTSMAAPHVAGAAALVLSASPEMTYAQIRNRLLNRADAKSGLANKVVTGGRLNAHQAIEDLAGPRLRLSQKALVELSGNSDAYANPGETHAINLTLENFGSLVATECVIQVSISSDAPAILNRSTLSAGNLAPAETTDLTGAFEILFEHTDTTPKTVVVTFTLSAAGIDATWSDSLEITIYKSSIIQGKVTRSSTNQPLHNAVVAIQGPASAQLRTDAEGNFILPAVTGVYQISASYPGLLSTETTTFTATESNVVKDLKIGNTDMTFNPGALRLIIPPDQTRALSVRLAQNGDTPRTLPIKTEITGSGLAQERLYGINLESSQPRILEINPESGQQIDEHNVQNIVSREVLGMASSGDVIWLLNWPSHRSYQLVPVSTSTWTIGTPVPLAFPIILGIGSADDKVLISAMNMTTGNTELHTYHPASGTFSKIGNLPASATGPIAAASSRESYFVASYESVSELNSSSMEQERTWTPSGSSYLDSLAYLAGQQAVYTVGANRTPRKHHPDNGTVDSTFTASAGIRYLSSSGASGPNWITTTMTSSDVPPHGGISIPLEISTAGMSEGQTYEARLFCDSTLLAEPVALDIELTIGIAPDGGTWEGWFIGYYGRLPNSEDPAADRDNDGFPDFIEFATGGEPGNATPHAGRPIHIIRGTPPMLTLEYHLRKSLDDTRVIPQGSNDLVSWQKLESGLSGATITRSSFNEEFDRVTVQLPTVASSYFLRLFGSP